MRRFQQKHAVRVVLVLILLLSQFLFFSCDLSMLQILDGEKASEDKNTFIITEAFENPSSFTLLLTSDQHFSRTDSGVHYETEAFLAWVKQYQVDHATSDAEFKLTHMISLGDITDNSRSDEFKQFADFKNRLTLEGITTYAVKGNHDIRPGTACIADWKTYTAQYSYQALAYKGVSFYLLNTANRTVGRIQMKELQEAVVQDKRPKLFFSHMPLYGKPSLLYTVLCDTQEREDIITLMVENKGMLYLSGHHHQGDVLYSFRSTTSEFILGAFHGRDAFMEQIKPRWYLLHYSTEDKEITITRYQVESDSRITETVMATLPVEL